MDSRKRTLLWFRLAAATVALIALSLLYNRLRPGTLVAALRGMEVGWFVAAVGLYGFLFLPAAVRWHLALQLSQSAISPGQSLRFSLIGHFLYTILLGAAGGDAAKSALYARAHRLSTPDILAGSSIDRLLGSAGLLLFAGAAFAIAASHGAFRQLGPVQARWPGFWALLAVAVVVIAILLLKRSRFGSAWDRFVGAFSTSCHRLIRSPRALGFGIGCGFLVQLALSGTLALNLAAISQEPLPWGRLIWTFPVISVVSALPITIGGLGVRDSAAFLLLGLCGVPGADALAAALLTAVASLLWAVAGGVLFASEVHLRRRESQEKETPAMAAHRSGR